MNPEIHRSIIYLCVSSRDEMEEVVASVYDLMGKTADPQLEEELIKQRVDAMFQVHKGCVSSH